MFSAPTPEAPAPEAPAPSFEAPAPAPAYEPAPAPAYEPAPAAAVASPAARSGSKLPWIIAAVLGVAAVVLAVLWIGKSGEADDLTKERDALTTELDSTRNELSAASSELDSTNSSLDSTQASLDEATGEVESLNETVTDLEGELDALQAELDLANQPTPLSDEVALLLGKAFGNGANPALNDDEARCLGSEVYNEIGYEPILAVAYTPEPTGQQLRELFRGFDTAVEKCNLDFARLDG